MNGQNYWRLGTAFGIVVIGLFVMGFMVSAYCRYTEFDSDDSIYLKGYDSKTLRASSSQEIEWEFYMATSYYAGKSCSSYSYTKINSGTLDPGESKTVKGINSYGCFKLEWEIYDCFECRDGQDKCDDYEYIICENGEWRNQGEVMGECDVECRNGDTECRAYDFYECNNFEWDKLGKKAGECGIECVTNNDCSGNDICSNYQCEQDPCEYVVCDDKCQNGIKYFSGVCQSSSGSCSYQTTNCPFGCAGEVCADDPCVGVDTSDICKDGIWEHDGKCSGGSVIYNIKDQCLYGCQNEPVEILAILSEGGMCRSSPCEGVTCNDYCSQTTKFTDGKCSNGKCIYSEEIKYSEECGHVPFYKTASFMTGMSIFVIIFILISFFIRKGKRK